MVEIANFADMEAEFVERAHAMVWCNCTTIDTRDRPRSRVLHPLWEGLNGWIATGRNTFKAKHLARNPFISLTYMADPLKPIYADCYTSWEEDPAIKARIWELYMTLPPPLGYDLTGFWKGIDDPEFGVLKLMPWRIELSDLFNPQQGKLWRQESWKARAEALLVGA